MKRIVGFDIGQKRIGIALSDLLGLTAQGVETYHRKNLGADYQYLVQFIKENDVGSMVVGLPKNMNNSLGFKAEEIQNFIAGLTQRVDIPVFWVDERLTTVSAERMLVDADISRKKRKNVVDKIAAVLILQLYLDKTR
jgi:RNAse H domain protein, YqgF family